MQDIRYNIEDEEIDNVGDLPIGHCETIIKSAVSNCSSYNIPINYQNYEHSGMLAQNASVKIIRKLQQQNNTILQMFSKVKIILKSAENIHNNMKSLFCLQQQQHKGLLQKRQAASQQPACCQQQQSTEQQVQK